MPRLSLVIPAYNNADFIAETLDSVLAQDFTDWELIVADHSSTDGTAAVIEPYTRDPRVTLVTTPAGGGAPRNWNRVTDLATAPLVKLICGDDVLRPGVLARQVELLDASPEAVATACARDVVDVAGVPIIRARGYGGQRRVISGAEAVRASIRAGTNRFGEPACVMLRTADLRAVGGWDGSYPYLIDQMSYSRVLLRGGFVADPETGAAFRLNGGQWSVALMREQARQAQGFHHWMRENHPEVVSASDVRVGDVRASIMALARRATYIVFARRMVAAGPTSAGAAD